jgi:hypothetical protein
MSFNKVSQRGGIYDALKYDLYLPPVFKALLVPVVVRPELTWRNTIGAKTLDVSLCLFVNTKNMADGSYRLKSSRIYICRSGQATRAAVKVAVDIRLPHALLMTILYGKVNSMTKAKAALKNILKAVVQHALHNGVVAAIYTFLTLSMASLRKRAVANKAGWGRFYKLNSLAESILAGLIAGSTVFRMDQNAVALQVSLLALVSKGV